MPAEPPGSTNPGLLEFLHAAIVDMQGTIRALDLKLNVLVVLLIVPLASLKDILPLLTKVANGVSGPLPHCTFPSLFALVWLIAIATVLRALHGITVPANLAKGTGMVPGAGEFYLPGLFTFRRRSVWLADKDAMPIAPFQCPPLDLAAELRFEQVKLAYIRDLKSRRTNAGYVLTAIWLSLWLLVGGANF